MLWYNSTDLLLAIDGESALYVWVAFAVTAGLVLAEQVLLTIRRHSILEYLGGSHKN